MSKWISASHILRAIGADPSCSRCQQSRSDCLCQSLSRMDICGIVGDAPEIDLVEVVRCKDCKHNPKRAWVYCPMAGTDRRTDDDFCSYAERKERE